MPESIDPNHIEAQFAGEAIDSQPQYSDNEQAHLDEIKRKRQAKFASMGVKTIPQQQIVESASSSAYGGGGGSVNNLNARDRILAIKQGVMKGKMRELQEAKSPHEKAHDANWMERDMKKKQQEARRKAMGEDGALRTPEMTAEGQKLKNNSYKPSSELDNIESMFTGGGSGPSTVGDAGADAYFDKRRQELSHGQGAAPQQNTNQQLISEDSFGGGAGNWEAAFIAKKQGWGQPNEQVSTPQNNQPTQVLQEHRVPAQNNHSPQPDLYQINQLIEKTVEKTVDNRVREILSEFYSKMESKKSSLTYQKVKGKKSGKVIEDVIMIEGKYYKISELPK